MTRQRLAAILIGFGVDVPQVCTAATARPGTWDVIGDGFLGRINIASVDTQGNLSGTVGGRSPNKPNPRLLG
jgi:hypothetical protein